MREHSGHRMLIARKSKLAVISLDHSVDMQQLFQ